MEGEGRGGDPETLGRGVCVLIVDPEASLRRTLARTLVASGFEVLTAEDGEAGLRLLASANVDVALVDPTLQGAEGTDFLTRLRGAGLHVEVIILSPDPSLEAARQALAEGAFDVLPKPLTVPDLVPLAVARAAEHKRLVSLTRSLAPDPSQGRHVGELVGSSKPMRAAFRTALGVAAARSTVLLLGESGTGKELLARAIHEHGPRRARRFLSLSCGALPPDLLEVELFGGRDRGPGVARRGLFEDADGGTLFLGDVAALPLPVQVKLLRVLQGDETVSAIAGSPRPVDVRLIAACDTDLRENIAAGRFREDLFYRLSVISIALPPLRSRRDDIPLLAYHFLRKHGRSAGREIQNIGAEAMRALRAHPWPGNVGELESCIESAVVTARGDTLLPADLPLRPGAEGRRPIGDGDFAPPPGVLDLPYRDAKERLLDGFHQAYSTRLLERTSQNVSEAARQAGLDRSNFRRLLRRGR